MDDFKDFASYLTDDEISKVAPMIERIKALDSRKIKQESFMSFVKYVWPQFIEGGHHKIYAQKLQDVADGKCKRLIINMPPRHTKSEFASYLFQLGLWAAGQTLKLFRRLTLLSWLLVLVGRLRI